MLGFLLQMMVGVAASDLAVRAGETSACAWKSSTGTGRWRCSTLEGKEGSRRSWARCLEADTERPRVADICALEATRLTEITQAE